MRETNCPRCGGAHEGMAGEWQCYRLTGQACAEKLKRLKEVLATKDAEIERLRKRLELFLEVAETIRRHDKNCIQQLTDLANRNEQQRDIAQSQLAEARRVLEYVVEKYVSDDPDNTLLTVDLVAEITNEAQAQKEGA